MDSEPEVSGRKLSFWTMKFGLDLSGGTRRQE